MTESEDDSDTNETFHDAETTPDEAHAPMPPNPLSPCRTCASGRNSSLARALVARVTTQAAATIAQSSLFAQTSTPPPSWTSALSPLRPHRSRPPVQAVLRVPVAGLLTAPPSPPAHSTPQPIPSCPYHTPAPPPTAPDTPLHHARVFFCYLLIF